VLRTNSNRRYTTAPWAYFLLWAMRVPKRSVPRKRRASRKPAPLGSVLLVVLGFVLAGLGGTGAYFMPVLTAFVSATGQNTVHHPKPDASTSPEPHPSSSSEPTPPPNASTGGTSAFTLLLLGSDNDAKFAGSTPLTQSMILVRVEPAQHQVIMLSLPRDLWVSIPGYGYGKIDEAYELGGSEGAEATIEQDFNVQVNQYIWIGLQGLVGVVNTVGGVDVIPTNPVLDDNYPNDLTASNAQQAYSYQRLAVMPGPQYMDGVQALDWVRSRHDDIVGDFGRSFRQQQLLVALREKSAQLTAADLPGLVKAFGSEVSTSLTLTQLVELLPVADAIKNSNIERYTLVGNYTSDETVAGEDVLIPNWNLILPLVHTYFPAGS
jgi:polyisoprenyl-teichoic acid--peptidoglycan teichoic acid transferase